MTLGSVAAAGFRLIFWCRACGHQVEPDTAELEERYVDERVRAALRFSGWGISGPGSTRLGINPAPEGEIAA
jgi:hypothetical protein